MLEVGADVAAMRQMFSIKAVKVLPWKDREEELKTEIQLLRTAMMQELQSSRDVYSKLIATGRLLNPSCNPFIAYQIIEEELKR